jgi:hypothetical protein
MENTINIYGLKKNNSFFYIGKNESSSIRNKFLNKGYCFQTNEKIKKNFALNGEVEVVVLKKLPNGKSKEWYDQKLKEVVDKHKENHPLVNAEWMKKGYRGYWQTKKRDANTIKKLSESKYKKIYQYNRNGKLIKIWNGGKEAAIRVFRDYRVVNGGGKSHLYGVIKNKFLKNRLYNNSYWFRESDLIDYFNTIPLKINIKSIIEKEEKEIKLSRKPRKTGLKHEYTTVYSIRHSDDKGNLIQVFDSIHDCMDVLKISRSTVRAYCCGKQKKRKYNLTYGVKKRIKLK